MKVKELIQELLAVSRDDQNEEVVFRINFNNKDQDLSTDTVERDNGYDIIVISEC